MDLQVRNLANADVRDTTSETLELSPGAGPAPHISSQRKRVLVLLENNPYPQDTRVRPETRTLAASGYKVTVIAPKGRKQVLHETIQSVRVYRYPSPATGTGFFAYVFEYGWALFATFVISSYVLIRHGFDIVQVANPPDTYAPILAFYRLLGKKIVFDHHDLSPELYRARFKDGGNAFVYWMLLAFERWSCRLAHCVLATNESYKRIQIERCGVHPSRITVVRNGPDPIAFRPVEPAFEVLQRAPYILCYCGTINDQDGVDYLLYIVDQLVHRLNRTDVSCVIMGDGDAMPGLRRLARELHIEEYVWFTGFIRDRGLLLRYLSAADVCVAPEPSNSYNDHSTMVKVLEYMALEKPIVAFDLPEHRFSAGDAAIYVGGNDPAAFANAISELLDDPTRRRTMGSIGRLRIEHELSWDHSAQHLLQAYEKLSDDEEEHSRIEKTSRWEKLRTWFARRPVTYAVRRIFRLLSRYGVSRTKATERVFRGVEMLAQYDCHPTFPVPGRVVEGSPDFFRRLQESGAELTVHGYDHVDFRNLTCDEARYQMERARKAFAEAGISAVGVRFPYLSATKEIVRGLSGKELLYSSNEAIWWADAKTDSHQDSTFRTLEQFYSPADARTTSSLPRTVGELLELPIAIPDDLQLYDGLHLRGDAMAQVWTDIVRRIHQRGELCVLMFHPELFDELCEMLATVLTHARQMKPAIWMARLRDISEWWIEKNNFSASSHRSDGEVKIDFHCSARGTVLVRNLATEAATESWCDGYRVLSDDSIRVRSNRLPFVGCAPGLKNETVRFLQEQGYILRTGDEARECATFLDHSTLESLTPTRLIEWLDTGEAPLVRFWRWPNRSRCALSMTGDLDALSLRDYLVRLF